MTDEGSSTEPPLQSVLQLQPEVAEESAGELLQQQQVHTQELLQEDEAAVEDAEVTCDTTTKGDNDSSEASEPVALKVIYNKRKIDLTFPMSEKVIALKRRLQEVTGVPVDMQKLMFRGLCQDDRVLSELGVGQGAKLMLVGSTPDSLASVRRPTGAGAAAGTAAGGEDDTARSSKAAAGSAAAAADGSTGVRISLRDAHKRVLEKYGRPDDLMPGALNAHQPLPPAPLSGMYNKQGAKVRLTFKLEIDELWIGTKERTNKIPMSSIKRIVSDPIEGQEAHHIMGLQLGTTEQSMYWVYWVPCQFVRAIKSTIGT